MTERFKQITRLADLITAELTGEINDADLEELERWKAASAENLALYEQYRSQAFLEKRYVLSGRIVGKRLIGILKMKREKSSVGKGV